VHRFQLFMMSFKIFDTLLQLLGLLFVKRRRRLLDFPLIRLPFLLKVSFSLLFRLLSLDQPLLLVFLL
jgi:hypothetical protein